MLLYYLKKYKIWLVSVIFFLIISITIYTKWYNSLITVNEFQTYITREKLLDNNLSFAMLGRDYDALLSYLDNTLPTYLDYDILLNRDIIKYNVTITLVPQKDILDNIYHSNYSEYLSIKKFLLEKNICTEGDFDVNNLFIER